MKARDFGHRLGEVLEASGFSKLQFSRQLQARRHAREARGEPPLRKVDRPALYAFLDGRDLPPLDTASEMAEILGVRVGWLAEGEEPMEQGTPEEVPPLWLVDGRKSPSNRLGVSERLQARRIFQEAFLSRSEGFNEAELPVQVVFKELLARRLARRRARGERATYDPAYRASTAWSLYLKCFLDVKAVLPPETRFSSPEFTRAFLERASTWFEDESD